MTTLPTSHIANACTSTQPPQAPAQLPLQIPRPVQIATVMLGLLLLMWLSSLLAQLV